MMAMEINGNYYNSYAVQNMAGSGAAKKAETKETAAAQKSIETAEKSSKSKSIAEYANELAKLVPSAEFKIGNSYSTAKTGITLTVSPKILEKMQNDPAMEKEMKELIKGVEAKNKLAERWDKMTGNTTVFCHDFIDANGKFCSFAQTRREDKLNKKLREEAQENAEKRIEKSRENAREKAEQLAEKLKENQLENGDEKSVASKAEQLLEEKMTDSKDGTIYLDDTDMKTMIEAMREEDAGKIAVKERTQAGVNLDLKI